MKSSDLTRTDYVNRDGKEAVDRAVATAGSHRARAAKDRGLTEHFTAWEWLDLCALTDFGCARCGEQVPLTPHHRIQLATCGSNTIDNIEPLCEDCHGKIPVLAGFRDVGAEWLADQQEMYRLWKAGELVGLWGEGGALGDTPFQLGVVVSVTPPELGTGRLYGRLILQAATRFRRQYGVCHIIGNDEVQDSSVQPPVQADYVETFVQVRLPGGGLVAVTPKGLTPVDPAAAKSAALRSVARQTRLLSKFRVGDEVTQRSGHWSHGVVMEIAPCSMVEFTGFIGEDQPPIMPAEWYPGAEAQARVSWRYSGTRKKAPKEIWVSLQRLKVGE